jgi:imidazolonepropionase
MTSLIKNISSLVTMDGNNLQYRIGKDMQNISEIKNGAILFCDKILWTGSSEQAELLLGQGKISPDKIIDFKGKTVLPGFVDSHTHIVFGGDRSGDFGKRLRGYTYQQIAEEGGGIQTTVKGTRLASIEQIVSQAESIAWSAIKHGTTAMEIKSGYGLSLDSEIKLLKAIKILKEKLPIHISTTFLGAHDFPQEFQNDRDKYVDLICDEMLPYVAKEGLAEYCDAFVDKGYYTVEQGMKIFNKAKELGIKIRTHADELADVNAAKMASEVGAKSADHLLFISDEGIAALKSSGTVATLLPGTAYFIRMPYAPARKIIDSGVIMALASDCNPGSCFTENMQLILSLAVINMKMTAEEALTAATINPAYSLGISHTHGSLTIGKNADFIVADTDSYINLFYHFGINNISQVWVNGNKII